MSDTTDRVNGTVIKVHPVEGYGFVKGEDGNSYFLHVTDYNPQTFFDLRENDIVNFKPKQTDRGLRALDANPGKV